MALNIRNEEVNRLAEALAAAHRTTKTDAVKQALEKEFRQDGHGGVGMIVMPAIHPPVCVKKFYLIFRI